tara:strand:- start:27 stop:629 length:603 start_codon:yes stop_codon:yes gene_type:complete
MENIKEVAPVVAGIAKGVAVAGKVAAKAAVAGGKAVAKGSKVAAKAAKTGAKATGDAAKGAAKASKPVARNLTKRRNVRNPRYRKPDGSFNKKLYDQDGNKNTQGYMTTIDGPEKSPSVDREIRQRQKESDAKKKAKETRDKEVQYTAKKLKKKTGDVIKGTVKRVGRFANKSKDNAIRGFGTSSFTKEGITFKDYLNKL